MHLEQAVLSLGRHHGVRAGRQLDCMVGEVRRADVRRRPALDVVFVERVEGGWGI